MESLSDGGVVALHKGQTPKVKTCAGQSFSQACITIFYCESLVCSELLLFLIVFPGLDCSAERFLDMDSFFFHSISLK